MSVTGPIPKEAMPIVKLLRKEVKRPDKLPTSEQGYGEWRGSLRWIRVDSVYSLEYCPMGLHPMSGYGLPTGVSEFANGVVDNPEAIQAFYIWWDSQTDPKAAVDAVWGKEKKKGKKNATRME